MNDYNYPPHFKLPDTGPNYFLEHLGAWQQVASNLNEILGDKPKTAIEIGSFNGASAVWILENICNRPTDFLHCIDINETEWLKNNLAPYKNVKLHLGLSGNVLVDLWYENKKPIADLVYVDGSHIAKHVLEDAVLSWKLLKVGGVLVFDDYGWGPSGTPDDQPKTGVDAFLKGYQKHYFMMGMGWQVYLQKIKYDIKDFQLTGNYAELDNPFLNKDNV